MNNEQSLKPILVYSTDVYSKRPSNNVWMSGSKTIINIFDRLYLYFHVKARAVLYCETYKCMVEIVGRQP